MIYLYQNVGKSETNSSAMLTNFIDQKHIGIEFAAKSLVVYEYNVFNGKIEKRVFEEVDEDKPGDYVCDCGLLMDDNWSYCIECGRKRDR